MAVQDDFQREERRSILLAGLAIILLAVALSPFGQLLSPSITILAFFWVIYAIGMTVYFSDDLFQTRTRRVAKSVALTSLFVFPFAAFLEILSASANAYSFPYISIIDWAMVAAGTTYAILIGGRIFRFHATVLPTPTAQTTIQPAATTPAIDSSAREKPTQPKQRRRSIVEKIPKPTITPLISLPATPNLGTPQALQTATQKLNRKQKKEDSLDQKKPLGPPSATKVPLPTKSKDTKLDHE